MDKKCWAIIGLVFNLAVLILVLSNLEDIFLIIFLVLGFISSIILFFKKSKLLIFISIGIPIVVLFLLARAIFSSGTNSIDEINSSVKDQIDFLFNSS